MIDFSGECDGEQIRGDPMAPISGLRTSTEEINQGGSLEAGEEYYIRVRAVTSLGQGEPSLVTQATPMGVPGAPQDVLVQAVPDDGTALEVSWNTPFDLRGSTLVGYVVQWVSIAPGSVALQ